MSLTILCCTDNSCPEEIFSVVRRRLTTLADRVGAPIICVSHAPVELGDNIVVGEQKRSWLTLYRQIHKGLEAVKTRNVAIAEHDCLYHVDHFRWPPPRDDVFYYNENVWLVQWAKENHPELNGSYSKFWGQRLALSQLICNRDLYLRTLEQRLDIIDKDRSMIKNIDHAGEPGVSKINVKRARRWADSGRPVYLKDFLGKVLEHEHYETFTTRIPNLDIRHDGNFTGPRRGKNRRMRLPYWKHFKDVMGG